MPKPNTPEKPSREERRIEREKKQERMLNRYTGEAKERYLFNIRPKNRIRPIEVND